MEQFHFYDRELETADRERLGDLQEKKLRRLAAALPSNEFYREKFRFAGVDLAELRRIEDISALPFTTKTELVDEQRAHPPFGRLLTYPISRYRYFHQTSGSTGSPLICLDTPEDWEWCTRCFGYVYAAAGVTDQDIVFCAFSFGPFLSHWAAMSGARHVGALCISGGGMNTEQRLHSIVAHRCTVLVCTPTYALRMGEVAHERGIDLATSGLRLSIHAGEPGASVPNVRKRIEELLGTRCFDHAGATEVGPWAFDCGAGEGAIHLNELEFIFEVVDGESGKALDEGERGELVVTNLGRSGMPVLRYRTGDLVEMTTAPCPCGRKMARIRGGVLGRADDMMIIRGVNVFPSTIDNVLRSNPHIVEYQVEIRSIKGLDDLVIKVETAEGQSFEKTMGALLEAFRTQLNIRVSVEHSASGSLPRYELKARRYKRIPEP